MCSDMQTSAAAQELGEEALGPWFAWGSISFIIVHLGHF
jgi:hypothetical protein